MKLSDIAEVGNKTNELLGISTYKPEIAISRARTVLAEEDRPAKEPFDAAVAALRPHFKGTLPAEPARKKRTPAEKGEMLSRKETNQKIGAALRKKEAETERKAPKPKVKPKKKKAPTKKKPAKAAE